MKALIKTTLLFCILFLSNNLLAQSDCSTALRVCNNATTGGNVSGYGIDDFYGADESGCLDGKGLPAIEVNSFWFRIRMDASGTFGFIITPAAGEDWDFAVYGPNNTSCGALGEPIRCNWDFEAGQLPTQVVKTGVGDDSGVGDHFDTWLNVDAGDEFLILVNKFDVGSVSGFEIDWQGTVFDNGTLDCTIKSDLGEDKNLCKSVNSNWLLSAKLAGVNQADIIYDWFVDTGSGYVSIPPTDPSAPWLYDVTSTGTYKVEVTDTVSGDFFDSEITVTFYNDLVIDSPPEDLVECEVSNNEAVFNLTTNGDLMIGSQNIADPSIEVRYYASEINAITGLVSLDQANDVSQFQSANATIWARIDNDGGCIEIDSFDLLVIDQPYIDQEPVDISACDVDQSLNEIIDLTINDGLIIGSQTNMIVLYDDDPDASTRWKLPIQDPANYIANIGAETIWAVILPASSYDGSVITSNCPYVEASFEITVFQRPVANPIQDLQQCDDDGVNNGYYTFNFTDQIAEVLGSQDANQFDINFYTQSNFTNEIDLSTGDYQNTNPYISETIYVKIQNKDNTDCFDTTSFTIQVFPQAVLPATIDPLQICDDTSDSAGSDTNGINLVNLTQMNSVILDGQSNTTYSVNYFEDATYTVQIPNYTTYENSIIGGQTIYVEVTNTWPSNSGCPMYTSFELQILEKPVILDAFELIQCNNGGGETLFNLNEATSFITLNNPSLTVSYFNTVVLAEENNPLNALPLLFSDTLDPDNIVYARIDNQIGCHRISQIDLTVSSTSFPSNYNQQVLDTCDDDTTADGLHTFMLSEATAEIITLFINNSSSSTPVVSYYRTEDDALLENNPINPGVFYINESIYSTQIGDTNNQDIYVRVENSSDGGCYGVGPYVRLQVNLRPDFELVENDYVCLNNLPKTISITNPQGVYTYEWFDAANNSLKNGADTFLEVTSGGNYSVIARSLDGCFSFQKQITITDSNEAQITDITIADDQEYSSVTVTVSGIGNYEFAIDNPQGIYQDSNIFNNVTPGIHTIYVQDKNGCGFVFEDAYVLGYPRFFTPNFDSYNETWNVRGVDSDLFPESFVYIYDRYGKQIHKMSAQDLGWNGTYNGTNLPSTDYWFIAELIDINGNTRKFQSHFSLIRK